MGCSDAHDPRAGGGHRRVLHLFRCAAVLGVVVAAVIAWPAAARAASLSVEVVPGSVALEPGGSETVSVIVRNGGDLAVRGAGLTVANNSEATVSIDRAPLAKKIARGEDRELKATITSDSSVLDAGTITFQVDSASSGIEHIATANLSVTGVPLSGLSDVATVDVHASLDTLDTDHPGTIYLVITNRSANLIKLNSVTPSGPPWVEFATTNIAPVPVRGESVASDHPDTKPVSVSPSDTKVVPITVSAAERVRPGKYLLLFDVGLTWGRTGHEQTAHIIATQPTDIGVAGVSDVLKVLSVPSFFLLPGFLIVGTLLACWRQLVPKEDKTPFDLTSAEGWVFAIVASIIFRSVWLGLGGHNYLSDYSVTDARDIGIAAIATGIGVWLILLFIRAQWRFFFPPAAPPPSAPPGPKRWHVAGGFTAATGRLEVEATEVLQVPPAAAAVDET